MDQAEKDDANSVSHKSGKFANFDGDLQDRKLVSQQQQQLSLEEGETSFNSHQIINKKIESKHATPIPLKEKALLQQEIDKSKTINESTALPIGIHSKADTLSDHHPDF